MNPLDQLRDEIANLHLLADRLARKSAPSHDLVAAADAMLGEIIALAIRHDAAEAVPGDFGDDPAIEVPRSIRDAAESYRAARARHAEGAQPSGAPAPCSVCKGSGLVKLSHDPSVIGVATCSACGGRGSYVVLGAPAPASAHVDREKAKLADEYAAALKELRDEDGGLYGWNDPHSGESIVGMEVQDAKDWLAQYEALEQPASAQGEVMPGQDNDGVWIDTTPPSSEKTGEERK